MNNRRDDELEVPSMVPERDEVASRSGRRVKSGGGKKGGGPASSRSAASGGMSGPARFLMSILTVGMIATGVAGWLFYTQGQQALAELEDASGRILSLENRLSAVGENTEETTLNLIERIDLNFSEIDKLWAARNTNRSDIADNASAIEEHDEIIGSMESALESQANMLTSANAQLNNLQTRVNNITENIAAMEDIDAEIRTLREQLSRLDTTVEGLESAAGRIPTMEQDIESINVYRLQLNQTISTLQDQVRNLQQRVESGAPQ